MTVSRQHLRRRLAAMVCALLQGALWPSAGVQAAASMEDMRKTLTNVGFGMFEDCPRGVAGPGITPSQ